MTREKKKVVHAPSDISEATEHLKDYAEANSKIKKIEAEIEISTQKIREKYKSKIEDLKEVKDIAFNHLQSYAEANKKHLFDKKKSFDMQFGLVGYRTGTPKVAKPRGTTWDTVLKLMKANDLGHYVIMKEDIDKKKIIASREDVEQMGHLIKIGVEVVQDETFFIEPKEEQIV